MHKQCNFSKPEKNWTNPLFKSDFVQYTTIMVKRLISNHLISLLNMYPTVTITGPRQSGKTTLARTMLPDWDYVSLEDPEIREFCLYDC